MNTRPERTLYNTWRMQLISEQQNSKAKTEHNQYSFSFNGNQSRLVRPKLDMNGRTKRGTLHVDERHEKPMPIGSPPKWPVQEQAVTSMACRWPCVTRGGACQFRLQFLFFNSPLHASAGFKENEGRQYWEKGTASEFKLAFRGGMPDLDGGIHCMKLALSLWLVRS